MLTYDRTPTLTLWALFAMGAALGYILAIEAATPPARYVVTQDADGSVRVTSAADADDPRCDVTVETEPGRGDTVLAVHPRDAPADDLRADLDAPGAPGEWLGLRPTADGTRLAVEYGHDWDAHGCSVALGGPDDATGFLTVRCARPLGRRGRIGADGGFVPEAGP